MRITLLVPGTGSFYCGSCLRDHALGVALRGLGHEVDVVPLYLPLYVEDERAGHQPVQMGGINLYLHQKLPVLEHLPRWMARGLDAPELLRWASRRGDMTSAAEHGEMLLSMLRGEEGRQRRDVERLAGGLARRERPDVCILSNAMLLGIVRTLRERLDVPVVCTLQGEAPYLDALPEELRALAWREVEERASDVDAFVAVSAHYGELMRARLQVPAERVHVVHNGIELDGLEGGLRTDGPATIGYLARMCPDKGLHTLVEAFLILHRAGDFPDLRLEAAGALLGGDRAWLRGLERRLTDAGLAGRFRFRADVSRAEKVELLRSLSVLSVPATYGESFGLYVLEALAAGVPVVEPRHAAFPELLAATGGGVLCEPDDPASLARELGGLLADPERARALGAAGRAAVRAGFTAEHMARGVADVCLRVASR